MPVENHRLGKRVASESFDCFSEKVDLKSLWDGEEAPVTRTAPE